MMNLSAQFWSLVERSKDILVVFPSDANGDALSGALACFLYLQGLGKNVNVATDNRANDLAFLPGFPEIVQELNNLTRFVISVDIKNATVDQIKYVIDEHYLNFVISPKSGFFSEDAVKATSHSYRYDLIITIGAPNLESLGKLYDNNVEFFYKTNVINIDNGSENEEAGQLNIVDLNAVAVSEIIFQLFKHKQIELINPNIATCLLAGIIARTKVFKTSNLTPNALTVTSELIGLGARREEIVTKLYRSRDLQSLKVWGKFLNALEYSADGKLVWIKLFKNDLVDLETNEGAFIEIIEELIINIPQTKIVAVFYSETENLEENQSIIIHNQGPLFKTKILLYAVRGLAAVELLKKYQGEGGGRIARAIIEKPLLTVVEEFKKELQFFLTNLPGV